MKKKLRRAKRKPINPFVESYIEAQLFFRQNLKKILSCLIIYPVILVILDWKKHNDWRNSYIDEVGLDLKNQPQLSANDGLMILIICTFLNFLILVRWLGKSDTRLLAYQTRIIVCFNLICIYLAHALAMISCSPGFFSTNQSLENWAIWAPPAFLLSLLIFFGVKASRLPKPPASTRVLLWLSCAAASTFLLCWREALDLYIKIY